MCNCTQSLQSELPYVYTDLSFIRLCSEGFYSVWGVAPFPSPSIHRTEVFHPLFMVGLVFSEDDSDILMQLGMDNG